MGTPENPLDIGPRSRKRQGKHARVRAMSREMDDSEGSYSHSIGMSDADSFDGRSSSAGSSLSGAGERIYDRRVARPRASVHTAAALEIVDHPRARLRSAPAVGSTTVRVKEPLIRSVTAPAAATALAGVVPTGADRLKHLQLHMEQLQQLYAHEIHKEELAVQEAFVQSMCTASITLWRYATSRSQFFTAVKALVTQYLPAKNAKLFQVEEEKSLSLVMADGSSVAVDDESRAGIGVAGNALLAVSRASISHLNELVRASAAQDVDTKMSESESSGLASSRSSASTSPSPDWLESHIEFIIPTTSEHLVLLLPLEKADGLNPAIDLHVKKRDAQKGGQLLVLVLLSANRRPIGILQALVSTHNAVKVDFLDAFSSLLAAAVEARQSFCRPLTADDTTISIVQAEIDAASDTNVTRTIEYEIAPSTKVVISGTNPKSPRDEPLLCAVRSSMSALWKEKVIWEQRAEIYERCERASHDFRAMVMTLIEIDDDCVNCNRYRDGLHKAILQLNEDFDLIHVLCLLFEEESIEDFRSNYGELSKSTGRSSGEDQYRAMKCVLSSGEIFVSTSRGMAIPIGHDGSNSRAAAFLELNNGDDVTTCRFVKDLVFSTVEDAVRLIRGIEVRAERLITLSDRESKLHDAIISEKRRRYEAESLVSFCGQVVQATSLETLVHMTNRFKWTRPHGEGDEVGWEGMRLTLCVVEFGGTDSDICPVITGNPMQIWSVSDSSGERVIVFDQALSLGQADNVQKARRGVAAFVLKNGRPILYTHQHAKFEKRWREEMECETSSRTSGCYYATPLPRQPATVIAESHGVLEVSFVSEDQRASFLKSPFCGTLITYIDTALIHFMRLAKADLRHKRDFMSLAERNNMTWARWMNFVSLWSMADILSIEQWIALTIERLEQLAPTADIIDLVVSRGSGDADEVLIARIEEELLNSDGSNSVALNLRNQALLHAIVAFPLKTAVNQHAPRGLLVVAKHQTNKVPFSDEENQLLVAASHLVETQLRYIWENSVASAQLNLLQKQLTDTDMSLNDERNSRLVLCKEIFQYEMVSYVHRFNRRAKAFASHHDLGMELVDQISSEMTSAAESLRISLMIALLISSGNENDEVWSIYRHSSTVHNANVSTEEIDWLLQQQARSVSQDTPHFELVSRIFGLKVDHVYGYHQLAATEVRVISSDAVDTRSNPGLLVLLQCERERSEPQNVVDTPFVRELGAAVEHAFFYHSLQLRLRHFQLFAETLEKENNFVQAERKRRGEWLNARTLAWCSVLHKLISEEGGCVQIRCSGLRSAVEHCTSKQLQTLLGDEISFTVEIKDVNSIPVEGLCLSEWSLISFDGTSMIEVSTDMASGMFLARSVHSVQDQTVLVIQLPTCSFNLIKEDIKNIACDVMSLLITINNTKILHDRVESATALSSSLRIKSQVQDELIKQLQATIDRRRHFSDVIQRMMSSGRDDESASALFDILRQLPEYRLWMRDINGDLWTTLPDGSKQIRSNERLSCSRDIMIGSDCVARLELLMQASEGEADQSGETSELQKLADVMASCFFQWHLKEAAKSMEAESEAQRASQQRLILREETTYAEISRHWHQISTLLHPIRDSDSLPDALSKVEEELLAFQEEIDSLKIILMDVDFDSREVLQVHASTPRLHGDCIQQILTLTDVWDTGATPSLRIVDSSSRPGEIVRSLSRDERYNGDIVLVSISERLPCPSVVVCIGSLSAHSLTVSSMVRRAFEMDTRLIIDHFTARHAHRNLLQRVGQAETELHVKIEELLLAQQWAEFSQNTNQEAVDLMQCIRDKLVDGPFIGREGITNHLITFLRHVVDCDTVELYVPNEIGHRDESVMLAPQFRDFSTGKHAPSTAQTQLELALKGPDVCVSAKNDRAVVTVLLSDRTTGQLLGIAVLHFPNSNPSNATLEITKTIVRDWLCLVFDLVVQFQHQHDKIELQRQQLVIQNSEMASVDANEAKLKGRLEEIEHTQAMLVSSLDLAAQNIECMAEFVDKLAVLEDEMLLLDAVISELCKHDDISGVQVFEERDGVLKLSKSTFSNAEDDELNQDERNTKIDECMSANAARRFRIVMSTGLVHGYAARLGDTPRWICAFYHGKHHPTRMKITEGYISHCIVTMAVRMKAIENLKLQVSAAETLEYATKDLSAQLECAQQALKREQESNELATKLYSNLSEDLIAHPVWKSVEKSASTSIRTPALVAAWIHLEEIAMHRIRRVLGGSMMVAQLYGCTVERSGGQEIVFSLPSKKPYHERKGFYCVPTEEIKRRRDWRGLTKCIVKKIHIASVKSSVDGEAVNKTIFFPVRFATVPELDSENGDETDRISESDIATVVGVLALKLKCGPRVDSPAFLEALQGFSDALACRVKWIGQVVSKKQQRDKAVPLEDVKSGLMLAARDDVKSTIAYALGTEKQTNDLQVNQLPNDRNVLLQQADAAFELTRASNIDENRSTLRVRSNQVEHGQLHCDEDCDSEDERRAELASHQIRAAIATELLQFSVRIQQMPTAFEGAGAILASLVSRELAQIWIRHGDNRKRALASCDLYFIENRAIRDTLQQSSGQLIIPQWLTEIDTQKELSLSSRGIFIKKVSDLRWIVCAPVGQALGILVVLDGGSLPMSTIFDLTDETKHLPTIAQMLAFYVARILERQELKREHEKQVQHAHDANSQRLEETHVQCQSVFQRAELQKELYETTLQLRDTTEERNLIQVALKSVKHWLKCGRVSFCSAASDAKLEEEIQAVEMETTLRVRIVAPLISAPGDLILPQATSGELIGVILARFSDQERMALDNAYQTAEDKAWLLDLLNRLARALAAEWVRISERKRMAQHEEDVSKALSDIQQLQEYVNALESERDRLLRCVEDLNCEIERVVSVEDENHRLTCDVDRLTQELKERENELSAVANKVKVYESQLTEVNCQLEQSVRAEKQLLHLEESLATIQARESRLQRKVIKQKMLLKHLTDELSVRRERDERDQIELCELRKQVAVLTEKQQHSGRLDASSVASAVMQAQLQVQQQQAGLLATQQSRDRRAHERRMMQQLQLQQELQKRKQLDLAQELRHLTALEVQAMRRREGSELKRPTSNMKVHAFRGESTSRLRTSSDPHTTKLRQPSVVVHPLPKTEPNNPIADRHK